MVVQIQIVSPIDDQVHVRQRLTRRVNQLRAERRHPIQHQRQQLGQRRRRCERQCHQPRARERSQRTVKGYLHRVWRHAAFSAGCTRCGRSDERSGGPTQAGWHGWTGLRSARASVRSSRRIARRTSATASTIPTSAGAIKMRPTPSSSMTHRAWRLPVTTNVAVSCRSVAYQTHETHDERRRVPRRMDLSRIDD